MYASILLISWSNITLNHHKQVFEAVLSWVKAEVEARTEQLADLLVKVRLPLMTPQYLADRVGSEDLIKTSLRCR